MIRCYKNNGTVVPENDISSSFLLIPEPFQDKYGKAIQELYYKGDGMFGGKNIFELMLEWNREMIPNVLAYNSRGPKLKRFPNTIVTQFTMYYNGNENVDKKLLGKILAEQGIEPVYPLKITDKPDDYKDVKTSSNIYILEDEVTSLESDGNLEFQKIVQQFNQAVAEIWRGKEKQHGKK